MVLNERGLTKLSGWAGCDKFCFASQLSNHIFKLRSNTFDQFALVSGGVDGTGNNDFHRDVSQKVVLVGRLRAIMFCRIIINLRN